MLEAQTMEAAITVKAITITMDNHVLLENEDGKGRGICPYKPKAISKRFL